MLTGASWVPGVYRLYSHTCHTTCRDPPLAASRAVQICSKRWKHRGTTFYLFNVSPPRVVACKLLHTPLPSLCWWWHVVDEASLTRRESHLSPSLPPRSLHATLSRHLSSAERSGQAMLHQDARVILAGLVSIKGYRASVQAAPSILELSAKITEFV